VVLIIVYMTLDLGAVISGIAVVTTVLIAVFSENNHKYIEKNELEISSKVKPIIDAEIISYQNATAESVKRGHLNKVVVMDSFRIALKDEGDTLNYGLLYFGGTVVYLLVLTFLSPYTSLNLFFQQNPPLPTTIFAIITEFMLVPIAFTGQKFLLLWKINKVVRGHMKKNEDLSFLITKYFSRSSTRK
jgi:hypothetical protein